MPEADDPDAAGSALDDAALAQRVRDFIRRARAHAADWLDEARTDYAFEAGDQWTEEERAQLAEAGRPIITFNRVGPLLEAVAGAEINNRQETKALPRGREDDGAAEHATRAIQWVRDRAEAADEESAAFRDLAICGMGWTEWRMDYCAGPDGHVVVERFDPAEALWDPAARARNLADAREVARLRRWRLDEAKASWPEKADELDATISDWEGVEEALDSARDRYAARGYGEDRKGAARTLEIVHYQWCEDRPVVVLADPRTGQRTEVEPDVFAALTARATAAGLPVPPHVEQRRRKWFHAFVAGRAVLERGPCPYPDGPTLRCMTGKLDRNTGHYYGIVRGMRDPQRWANMFFVQSHHILATSTKSGLIAEETAADDFREVERTWAMPGAVTKLRPGGLNMIREKQATNIPAAFERMMQLSIAAIPDVTGISREMLGTVDRNQPGVLEAHRKQASQAVLAPLFDSLRRYRKGAAPLILHFVRAYLPPDTVMRVVGEDGQPRFAQLALLPEAARFDFVVDEAPTSPNAKTEAWAAMVPMLPAILKMGPPPAVIGEILRFSPIPASAVERIIAALKPPGEAEAKPDPDMMKAQADIQARQARTQADIAMRQAETEAGIELKALETQADIALKQAREQARQQEAVARALARATPGSPFAN